MNVERPVSNESPEPVRMQIRPKIRVLTRPGVKQPN